MRPKHSGQSKASAERVVKDIRRATRRHFSAEDKIRIVLEGLRGDDSIAELCRKEGIAQSLYYVWLLIGGVNWAELPNCEMKRKSGVGYQAAKGKFSGCNSKPNEAVHCRFCAISTPSFSRMTASRSA